MIEEQYGRSIMSGMHGWWSAGVLAGSGGAAVALRITPDGRPHLLIAAAVCAVVSLVASAWLLPHRADPEMDPPPAFALPSRAVLLIGLVGLCARAEASVAELERVGVSLAERGRDSLIRQRVHRPERNARFSEPDRNAGHRPVPVRGPPVTARPGTTAPG